MHNESNWSERTGATITWSSFQTKDNNTLMFEQGIDVMQIVYILLLQGNTWHHSLTLVIVIEPMALKFDSHLLSKKVF